MPKTKLQESGANCTPEPKEPCRVCMTKLKKEVIPIFGDGTRPDISADIITFGSIELSRDDDLPKYLCKDCLKWLKSAVLFRETAQQSDLILRRRQKRKHNTLPRKFIKPIKIETLTLSSKIKYYSDTKDDSTETLTYPALFSLDEDEIKQNLTNIKNEKSDDEVDLDIQIEMDTDKYKTESGEVEVLIDSDDKKNAKTDKTSTSPNFHCTACALDFRSLGEYDQHLTKYHDDTAKTKCEICKKTCNSHAYKQHLKRVHKVGDGKPVQDIFLTNQEYESDEQENYLSSRVKLTNEDDKDNLKIQSKKKKCEICKKSYNSRYYKEHLKRVHKIGEEMPKQDIFLPNQVLESDDQESYVIIQVNSTDENDEDDYLDDDQLDVANRTSIDEIKKRKAYVNSGKSFSLLKYQHHFKTKHLPQADKNTKHCEICKMHFSCKNYYRHIKTHHNSINGTRSRKTSLNERVQCEVCNKTYSGRYIYHHLQQHKFEENQKHTGIGRFICDQCGKMFNFQSTFNNHCLTHTDSLPYKCDHCPYRTRTKCLLIIHLRIHTGEYNYKCTQCSARLLTKSNLNAHMRRHRGAIDFMCDQCSRGFYSKLELERHKRAVHLGIRNHICNVCGKAFGYRHQMTRHTRKVHKREKLPSGRLPLYLQMELKKKEAEEKEAD